MGLRDLDLERLSDRGNVRFDAWSFVSLDEETSPRPQHHGTLNMRERDVDMAWTIVSKDEQVLPWSTKLKPGNAVRARAQNAPPRAFSLAKISPSA